MQPTTDVINDEELNKATDLLMSCLPDHAEELVHELAKDYQLPYWQVFAGVVYAAHLQGSMSGFTTEPAWAEGVKHYIYRCKQCGQEFKPTHVGQLYCTTLCGNTATEQVATYIELKVATNDKHEPTPTITNGAESIASDDFASRLSALTKKTDSGWTGQPDIPVGA